MTQEALKRVAEKLRRTGASIPAPEVTGTIEGSVVTGLCIALALVETEIEALADPMRNVQRLGQEIEQEPTAKYSDIVSDGGFDPRNKFDAPPQRTDPLIGCVNHDCAKCKLLKDERLELIGHADLAINNIYIFNGYGEDVPEDRTPIYAGYKAAHGIKETT